MRGIPGVAFSYVCSNTPTFPHVKQFIPQIINYLIAHPLPYGSFLNVNFPHTESGRFSGYKMARQGKGYWIETPQYDIHPEKGHTQYWMHGMHSDHSEHDLSDVALLDQGYITAVPIHIDELTDHIHLKEKKEIFDKELNPSP